jgi:hypothetical protein
MIYRLVFLAALIFSHWSFGPGNTLSAADSELLGVVVRGVHLTATALDETSHKTLGRGQRLIVDGRDQDNQWLHVQSELGAGYVVSSAVKLTGDVNQLPIVDSNLPQIALPDSTPVDDPSQYPIMPQVPAFTHELYRRGLAMGNRRDVFAKAGDCMTADNQLFLGKFGEGQYNLGAYGSLKDVIDYYSRVPVTNWQGNSLVAHSQAAITGFNVITVEDPTFADPAPCNNGETPLSCEYRLVHPSVAIIMFGTNDVIDLNASQFNFYLRLVVLDTVKAGVIPLLSTFPGVPGVSPKSNQFNQIIFQVARDYQVPVMNLWLALQPLPGHGRNPDSVYLSRLNDTNVSSFEQDNLRYGYTLRNLVTLQSLDIIWRGVIQEDG